LLFRPVFRLKLFGKVLLGLREWASSANAVLEAVDDLYAKFRDAPEAHRGQIPIVELTKTIPVTTGRGARQSTIYAPGFVITGWTDRVPEMGARTVSAPTPRAAAAAGASAAPIPGDLGDSIPY
jgi:hypothetical protein